MKIIIAIIYVVLFQVSAKLVFAILGGYEMNIGLFGIDWMGVMYMFLISLLASMVTVLGVILAGKNHNTKQSISIAVIAIIANNIYQFVQSPNWFLNTLESNTVHIISTNLVFGSVLVAMYYVMSKANQALNRTP